MNFFKKSLAKTLSGLIAIILLMVFTFIGIVNFNFTSKKIEEDLYKQTLIQSESITKEIEHIFDSAAIYAQQMSLNRDVIRFIKNVKSWRDIRTYDNYEYVYDYLKKVQASEEVHFISWFASIEGNYYLDSRGITSEDGYECIKRPWYPVAVGTDGVGQTPPYQEWTTNDIVISNILALREAGEVYGVVAVDIQLTTIPRIIEGVKINELDKNFILTAEGNYVYHENPEMSLDNSIMDESDGLYSYRSLITNPDRALHQVTYNGRSYYLMSHRIENNGWYVVSLIDHTTVQEGMNDILRVVALVMAGFFVLAIIAIYIIVTDRTSPYDFLVSFAEDIANGDYNHEIPEQYLERPDEMGALSHSFQKITNAFKNENSQLEEQVSKINEVLEKQYAYILETEKAASLGNLVAGVSHEINTPLGVGISTSSYMETITEEIIDKMMANTMSKDDLLKYFERISESSDILNSNLNRAAGLVRSFKNIAVDQGSEIKEQFQLAKVIEDVVTSLKNEYKRKRHTIYYACDEDIYINSYPGLFAQMFTNLTMNAIQHAFRDRMDGKININCWIDGDLLFIIFEDNGRGIPEEDHKKVFEPFYTTYRENGNSGLGMSIIHNIITQNLNGKIQMESKVDEYTKFTIVIPIEK